MYLSCNLFSILLILNLHYSIGSICSENSSSQSCECEEISHNGQAYISLKCSTFPTFQSDLNYRTIEFDFCSEDLDFQNQPFKEMNINILRIRHCNLLHLNDQSFSNIHQFEKFYLENSTIKSLSTGNGNFQDIFSSNSFAKLKSLSLKTVHYHQTHSHDKKLNLELLLQQLPRLNRLELIHIHLDDYRYSDIQSIGENLTYLSLTNTHQTSLLPIAYFQSLERLLIRHLPEVFRTQPLISSLGNLKHLKYILFEHDQLKTIEHLRSNSIDDIDFSSNLIESIEDYTFEYVPKLRQLTLTSNPLHSIDRNAFCGIENLQRLSIRSQHRLISPLDNCLLIKYPHLQIIQDSQTKFQCNCQLFNVFHVKRHESNEINRSFKLNQVCLYHNETISSQAINLYELEHTLNCSASNTCQHLCVERKMKVSSTTSISQLHQINPKYSSSSITSYSSLAFLLLCFLYL